jgi:hypothetical protein
VVLWVWAAGMVRGAAWVTGLRVEEDIVR